ncbi:hypothetical protein C8R47DRAFT_616035 [Mycena vitilis]|nr:hypothetical protein C8R47DRAFT_616035 [Mycena vitilis]
MSSIALLPFTFADEPLSNGISAIPDLDDIFFGGSLADDPAYFADAVPPSTWAAPGTQEVQAACVSIEALTSRDGLVSEEDLHYAFNEAAARFHAVDLAGAAHEDDGWDSEWDADSEDEYEMKVAEDSRAAVAFEATAAARPLCPLPGRPIPQGSALSTASRAARASPAVAVIPTATVSNAAPPSASKKRKATRAAGPAASQRRAVGEATTTRLSVPCIPTPIPDSLRIKNRESIPYLVGITDDGLPLVPGYENVEYRFHGLFRLGCTAPALDKDLNELKGMAQCYACEHYGAFADMWRHVLTHQRPMSEVFCSGCPRSFARGDSLKRHAKRKGGAHSSAARKAFLADTFEKLPEIIERRRAHAAFPVVTVKKFNLQLDKTFTDLYAVHCKTLATKKSKSKA